MALYGGKPAAIGIGVAGGLVYAYAAAWLLAAVTAVSWPDWYRGFADWAPAGVGAFLWSLAQAAGAITIAGLALAWVLLRLCERHAVLAAAAAGLGVLALDLHSAWSALDPSAGASLTAWLQSRLSPPRAVVFNLLVCFGPLLWVALIRLTRVPRPPVAGDD